MTPERKDWLQGRKATAWIALGALLLAVAGCAGLRTDYDIARERAAAYVTAHPGLDRTTAEAIRANRVHKGMTKEQAVAAWGRPATVKRFGGVEQWFFGCGWPHSCNPPSGFREAIGYMADNYYNSQAIFENGVVTDVKS